MSPRRTPRSWCCRSRGRRCSACGDRKHGSGSGSGRCESEPSVRRGDPRVVAQAPGAGESGGQHPDRLVNRPQVVQGRMPPTQAAAMGSRVARRPSDAHRRAAARRRPGVAEVGVQVARTVRAAQLTVGSSRPQRTIAGAPRPPLALRLTGMLTAAIPCPGRRATARDGAHEEPDGESAGRQALRRVGPRRKR